MMIRRTGRSEEVALATRPGETVERATRTPRARAMAGGWEGVGGITGQGEPRLIEARRGTPGEARAKRVAEEEAGQEPGGVTTDFTETVATG